MKKWLEDLINENDLFGNSLLLNPPPKASKNIDPVTSHMAEANIIKSGKRETHAQMVLKILQKYPGSTSAELSKHYTEVHPYKSEGIFTRRLADLKNKGHAKQGDPVKCSVRGTLCVTWYAI